MTNVNINDREFYNPFSENNRSFNTNIQERQNSESLFVRNHLPRTREHRQQSLQRENFITEEFVRLRRREIWLTTLHRIIIQFWYHLLFAISPFLVFNVLKGIFDEITFSKYGFISDILNYIRYVKVFNQEGDSLLIYRRGLGLIVKFHNVTVFYFSPLLDLCGRYTDVLIKKIISGFIKILTVVIYMIYGLMASSYIFFAALFFTLCFSLTLLKRYKSVEQILKYIYYTTKCIF